MSTTTNRYADIAPDVNGDPEVITYADRIRANLLTTAQLRAIPPPQPLIDGWLYRNSLATAYGRSGAGKTHVVMDMANAITTQRFWHSNPITNGGVFYIIAEG